MLAIDWVPWLAGVCALSVVGLVLIVVAPSRRLREQSRLDREQARLDREIETRLLLGEDPEELDRELDGRSADPAPVADLHPDNS